MNDEGNNALSAVRISLAVEPQNVAAHPTRLLQAVSDPIRWRVLRELVAGQSLTVQQLAAKSGSTQNQMSKHLRVLREVGALELGSPPDGDKRKAQHAVPKHFLRPDESGKAVIDFGACVLRFP